MKTSFRERFQGDRSVVKEKKDRLIRRGSLVLAVIGFMALAGECPAFPYRPAAAVSILSEYPASKAPSPPHTQVWKVVPEGAPDGSAVLRFFLEASTEAVTVCALRLPPPGTAGEIRWEGMGRSGKKTSSTGMLLVPGFPAPCDVLPVGPGDGSGSGVYAERIEAGGRVFSKNYRISSDSLTVGEARAMGWIRVEDPGSAGLIMVTVTDDKARLVVKQLWPADGSWWLYEETPLRRSWLY